MVGRFKCLATGSVLLALALVCASPRVEPVSASDVALHAKGHEYPLPSADGAEVDGTMLARLQGTFHAGLTPSGACAWLAPLRRTPHEAPFTGAFVWPDGYRVRFHPTELINPKGRVVAREGDKITSAGGTLPSASDSPGARRCGKDSQAPNSDSESSGFVTLMHMSMANGVGGLNWSAQEARQASPTAS